MFLFFLSLTTRLVTTECSRKRIADEKGYATYSWGKSKYEWYNSKDGHHQMAMAEGGH